MAQPAGETRRYRPGFVSAVQAAEQGVRGHAAREPPPLLDIGGAVNHNIRQWAHAPLGGNLEMNRQRLFIGEPEQFRRGLMAELRALPSVKQRGPQSCISPDRSGKDGIYPWI